VKIDSIKQLKQIIALCRSAGVSDVKIDGIEMHLGPLPVKRSNKAATAFSAFPEAQVPVPAYNGPEQPGFDKIDMPDDLSDEQKLFWSAESRDQQ